jgi:hypothetical protein
MLQEGNTQNPAPADAPTPAPSSHIGQEASSTSKSLILLDK